MTTLLTGGTGFVGRQLMKAWHARSSELITCSRDAERARKAFGSSAPRIIAWDPLKPIDSDLPSSLSAVINLMGESIADGRWTAAKKKRIVDSRVVGTRNLVTGILNSNCLPSVLVSASAVGIYGNCGEDIVSEKHALATGFLADVCQQWEAEANRLGEHGVRVVNLRIGIVLGADGGALEQMEPIFRWGVGGRLGSGKQWVPWIHVDDLVRLILWSVDETVIQGPVNATAPNPVRNSELTAELARRVGRPAWLPVPKFAVRLAFGEFANSLFDSQRVVPEIALRHGFRYEFPELRETFEDLLR